MKKGILILLFISATVVYGQQDFTLYNLNEIPQSNYSNPSNQFNGKFYIGLPVISSTYFSLSNSGFAYSDAIKKSGDSLLLDFDELIDNLGEKNYLSFYSKIDLLSFGLSISKRTQLQFNISENFNFRMSYPKDFIQFVYEGNAAFEDNTANFEGIGLSLNHYREYAAGVSHQLTEKLRIGGKLKFLKGMQNVYTKRSEISVYTDPQTFEILAKSDMEIHTSGLNQFDSTSSLSDYLSQKKNNGMAIDLGANYDYNEKLSFSASLLDLGYIHWKTNTNNYSNNGSFQYSGIGINSFSGSNNQDSSTSFARVLDSLKDALNIDSTTEAYNAPLTARIYLGTTYKINERSSASGILQAEIFQRRFHPSLSLIYHRKLTKSISLGASYTMVNRTFTNLGLAINFNPGPVQFYLVTDNIFGAFQPQHSRHFQLRFGINFIFGSKKSTNLNAAYKRGEESAE